MSTYLAYQKYYGDLNQTHPELTTDQERRAQLSEYAAHDFLPPFSEKTILDLLEKHSLTYPPRPLPRYSRTERAQRKERSDRVREAVFDFLIDSRRRGDSVHVPRQYGNLLEPETGDAPSPRNQEVARLFGSGQEETSPTAQQELAQRRSALVMEAVSERSALLEHLDEMTDETLPPEQLAQNYKKISEAWELSFEMDNILQDVDRGYLQVTEEQKQTLLRMKAQQERFVDAREKLNNLSNPVYEFLDIRQLDHYDLDGFGAAYEELQDDPTSKDALNNFVEDFSIVNSSRYNRISDAYEKAAADYSIDGSAGRRFAESLTDLKTDTANNYDLFNGKTVVLESGERTVILSRVSPDSGEVTMEAPGRLFDQFLTAKNKLLTKELEDADPAFLRSSKEFKAMKESLRQVNKLAPLGDSPSQRDIDRARREFSALLRSSKEYRSTKGARGRSSREQARIDVAEKLKAYAEMKLDQLTAIEKAQRTLEKYRGMTPEQIRSQIQQEQEPEQAEAEAFRRDAQSHEAAREAQDQKTVQEDTNRQPDAKTDAREAQDQKTVQEDTNRQPDAKTEDRSPDTELSLGLPAVRAQYGPVLCGAEQALRQFQSKTERQFQGLADHVSAETAKNLLASVTLLEMIHAERAAGASAPGELEQTLLDGSKFQRTLKNIQGSENFKKLFSSALDPDTGAPDAEKLKNLLLNREPAKLAQELAHPERQAAPQQEAPKQSGPRFTQELAEPYASSIKPMRGEQLDESEKAFLDFTDKRILDQAKEYDKLIAAAGGDPSAEMDSSARIVGCTLLQNCVIHSMVQLERESLGKNGPGNLEKMVQDPKKLPALWKAVQSAPDFHKLMEEKLFRMGETPAMDTVLKFMEQKEPQRIAKDLLQQAVKARQSAQTAPAKQPQRQQDAPVKQPQQPKL